LTSPSPSMAKPNYSFEKRQRELAKQKKKAEKDAEKAARKRAGGSAEAGTDAGHADEEATAPGETAAE
ncbi:MAG TPA: hypothetical protein PLG89_01170, partial [Arenimonas sp.]|nr:hypothetical protein [Arenimonas sp.]